MSDEELESTDDEVVEGTEESDEATEEEAPKKTSLANEEERSFALTGLWYRMSDKINRWKNLIINNRGVNNEPLSDTFQDICNYAIICQLVEKDQWKK